MDIANEKRIMNKTDKVRECYEKREYKVGIIEGKNKFTFFVVDRNVTWHGSKWFKDLDSCKKRVEEYLNELDARKEELEWRNW